MRAFLFAAFAVALFLLLPAHGQCVSDPVVSTALQFDVDYLFRGLDRSLGTDFPAWLSRWKQDNTTDPTPVFVAEDNCQNGIDDDDHLDLLAAILKGEPSATVLSGISPANVAAIRTSYAANRAKVRPDLTLTIIFVTVNIIEEIEKDDPDFGASLQDLVAAYMTIGDAESVAYIRNLLITLGEIFIEIGVANGDIPGIVEGLTKTTLRNTVNANYTGSRYECYGDVAGTTKPNLLGDTGNIGGNAQTNEQAYEAVGRNRQAWLIAKGVAKPPLEITAPPSSVSTFAGVPAPLTATVLGGTGAAVTYDWKRVNSTTLATSAAGLGNPFGPLYPLAADAGLYQLFVCDGTWQRTATPVSYAVAPTPFEITAQPESATRNEGESVTFSVTVRGGGVLPTYRWYEGPSQESLTEIPGQVSQTLVLENLIPADSGLFQVRITGGAATATTVLSSVPASLLVNPAPDTEAPVLTLNGAGNVTLSCGTAYAEPGATALDDQDGDITGRIQIQGIVDSFVPGTYTLTYSVSDIAGNQTQAVRAVVAADNTPPILQVLGANPLILACKDIFVDPGTTATDLCSGDLGAFVQASGAVNRNIPGNYTRVYTVQDSTGNKTTATRTVIVIDNAPPTITRLGSAAIVLGCGVTLSDPGAVASDACAGNLDSSVVITGEVDTTSPGSYVRTYTVTDPYGNSASTSRTFVVSDTAPPVLSLIGTSPLQVTCGGVFNDPGATAQDACQGNLGEVVATGNVNTALPGSYNVTYTATDAAGNLGQVARTVEVVDTTAPLISLIVANSMTLECGTPFNDPGATATDACSGNITVPVVISGTVSTGNPGTYTRTYTATDSAGNSASITRSVIVADTNSPVVALNGSPQVTLACGNTFSDPGANAIDACDGVLGNVEVSGTFDATTAGNYTLTYSARDRAGNVGQKIRTITVLPSTTPVLTLLGDNPTLLDCGSPFVEPGYVASRGCDGDLTDSVVVSGAVDPASPGTYVLTYEVLVQGGGQASQVRTVNVVDRTPPVLSLLGDAPQTLACGAEFTDPGAAAIDRCEGDLSPLINVVGTVNAAQPGIYTRVYTVGDRAGNTASLTRTIEVTTNTTAAISLLGPEVLSISCGQTFLETGFVAQDTCGETATGRVTVSGNVDSAKPGVYRIVYQLAAQDGGPAQSERIVTVLPDCAIALLEQPRNLRLYEGQEATFAVRAEGGSGPLQFQWYFAEVEIDGADASILLLRDIDQENAGEYHCVVGDGFNEIDSDHVTLEVFSRPPTGQQSADSNGDWSISLTELLRLIQFYNVGALSCAEGTEDGFAPGAGTQDCAPHTTDYAPQNWVISLSELLRTIQFYNSPGGAYRAQEDTEDGFAPGAG